MNLFLRVGALGIEFTAQLGTEHQQTTAARLRAEIRFADRLRRSASQPWATRVPASARPKAERERACARKAGAPLPIGDSNPLALPIGAMKKIGRGLPRPIRLLVGAHRGEYALQL